MKFRNLKEVLSNEYEMYFNMTYSELSKLDSVIEIDKEYNGEKYKVVIWVLLKDSSIAVDIFVFDDKPKILFAIFNLFGLFVKSFYKKKTE